MYVHMNVLVHEDSRRILLHVNSYLNGNQHLYIFIGSQKLLPLPSYTTSKYCTYTSMAACLRKCANIIYLRKTKF